MWACEIIGVKKLWAVVVPAFQLKLLLIDDYYPAEKIIWNETLFKRMKFFTRETDFLVVGYYPEINTTY